MVYTPLFYYLKRRDKAHYQAYTFIHVFGILLSIMLISIHFGWHLGMLKSLIMNSATGLPLYTSILFMLVTGFNLRFQLSRKYLKLSRSLHMSFLAAFFLIIFFHVLHGIRIP